MTNTLPKPLAFGRTAEIYPWGEDQVLKLFYQWFSPKNIEYEQRITQAIQKAGLPVPEAGEIIRVDGRNGLIYQRVDGKPMGDWLFRHPWMVNKAARRTAALHVEMHSSTVQADIPLQHERLARKIESAEGLSNTLRGKALAALGTMPTGDCLCHGDYHPGNILITHQGQCIIDWIDATIGNPLADVARTTILLLGAADCQVSNLLIKDFIRLFHYIYLHSYFQLSPGGKQEYRCWLPIVAAARMSEGMQELERWLMSWVVEWKIH